MKKEDALSIAATILETGLGWAATVVDMVSPENMFADAVGRTRALARCGLQSDWVILYYENGILPDTVRSFSTMVAWRLFYVDVARSVAFNYPGVDSIDATARWYPARKAVVFTGEWEDVPLMPAAIKPTEELVLEWIKFQRKKG